MRPEAPGARLSLLRLFARLVLSPAAGVARTLREGPELKRIAVALGVVGLLRGLAEGLWYYAMLGRLHQLPALLQRPEWYSRYGGPFVILNIPSAHFLWLTTAVILHLAGRMLGGQGHFRRTLQVTGIALFSYVAIGLINYLHLWFRLPSITMRASAFYSPNLGVGQLVTFVWLTAVCYQVLRQVYGLPAVSALLGAPLPVLVSLLLYLTSAAAFFGLLARLSGGPGPETWLAFANWAYMAATVFVSLTLAFVSRTWLRGGDQHERSS